MTVESNYAIAIATLSDWFKNLAPVYQPMKSKTKTNRNSHARFSRALSKLHGITTNLDWFIALFALAVIGRSNYFGICFTTYFSGFLCHCSGYSTTAMIILA